MLRIIKWKNIKINQKDMLKNIRTQNNKIQLRSYTRNHSIQACNIDVLLAITNSIPQNNKNKAKIIYNKKLKAELNACGTVTFRAIPGLKQASELGEAVFPSATMMIRKAIQNHI